MAHAVAKELHERCVHAVFGNAWQPAESCCPDSLQSTQEVLSQASRVLWSCFALMSVGVVREWVQIIHKIHY
jgi:hypothetical protein